MDQKIHFTPIQVSWVLNQKLAISVSKGLVLMLEGPQTKILDPERGFTNHGAALIGMNGTPSVMLYIQIFISKGSFSVSVWDVRCGTWQTAKQRSVSHVKRFYLTWEEIRFQFSPGLLQNLSIFGIYLLSHLLIPFLHTADCSPVSFHPPLSSFWGSTLQRLLLNTHTLSKCLHLKRE